MIELILVMFTRLLVIAMMMKGQKLRQMFFLHGLILIYLEQ